MKGGKGRGTDTVPVAMDLPREKVLDLIPHATERETNFIRETGAGDGRGRGKGGTKPTQKQKHKSEFQSTNFQRWGEGKRIKQNQTKK